MSRINEEMDMISVNDEEEENEILFKDIELIKPIPKKTPGKENVLISPPRTMFLPISELPEYNSLGNSASDIQSASFNHDSG